MHYALINQSKDTAVSQDVLIKIAIALTIQLSQHVAPWCETSPNSNVSVYPDEASVPSADQVIKVFIVDEIPEAPDALAYHTIDAQGRPMCRIGWGVIKGAGGTLYTGSMSLSGAISHEVVEADNDPYVNFWADFSDTEEVAEEYCDPVEGDSYNVLVANQDGTFTDVAVSNFISPRWFSDGPGPYDFMKQLRAPRSMSTGGYMVLRTGGPAGKTRQVFGKDMPEWKRVQKVKYGRRAQAATRKEQA